MLIMKIFNLAVSVMLPLAVAALPHFTSQPGQQLNHTDTFIRREVKPPAVPKRPEGVSEDSFHVSQFEWAEEFGFNHPGSPIVEAAPVYLFARTTKWNDPCYPESAILIGSNPTEPNPGTDWYVAGTPSLNPGADCTNAGPYHGRLSKGDPFPVYVSVEWCGDVWKIIYSTYFVHDGTMLEGHQHDWEYTTVVFAKDPASSDVRSGGEWWYRAGVHMKEMDTIVWYKYSALGTMSVEADMQTEAVALELKHPKVWVGFFDNAGFGQKFDSWQTQGGGTEEQYRSDDWWRLPQIGDFRSSKEINPDWDYGLISQHSPPNMRKQVCQSDAFANGDMDWPLPADIISWVT